MPAVLTAEAQFVPTASDQVDLLLPQKRPVEALRVAVREKSSTPMPSSEPVASKLDHRMKKLEPFARLRLEIDDEMVADCCRLPEAVAAAEVLEKSRASTLVHEPVLREVALAL